MLGTAYLTLLVRSPFLMIKGQLACSVSSGQNGTVGTRDSTEEGGGSGGRLI